MKKLKKISALLLFSFVLVLLWSYSGLTSKAAATPKFKYSEIELTKIGEKRVLEILNKVKNSTYKWSSSNETVARVSKSGVVTAVGIGKSKIQCKITYESGKTKVLSCNVTVTIPATNIKINNATVTNGAHVMMVGESYTFNTSLTPSNSTDKVYWSIDETVANSNINAIRIDDNTKGTVTALRRGRVVLVATAAREATAKAAKESFIKDAIIIEVIGSSAEVVSAEILDSKTIRVVFGTEIRESTVVKSDGTLSNSIAIDRLMDSSGKKAADPGKLTAILSKNMKTLTITTSNALNGYYGISFSNSILTDDGSPIYKDYINLSYINNEADSKNSDKSTDSNNADTDGSTGTSGGNSSTDNSSSGNTSSSSDNASGGNSSSVTDKDTLAPELSGTMLDDDGMTNIISFTKKMDFSRLQVSNARVGSNSVSIASETVNYINNESNYSFSADGKSIIVNLANINTEDYDKAIIVTISGITDEVGNTLKNGSIDVILRTSTSPMPQARVISVIRTSYDTLTATFTRAIKTPGWAYVNNGSYCEGKVNPENNKQVIYTLSDYDASLTGVQKVSIGFWDSYNVMPNDTTANKLYDFNVNFTTEKVKPTLASYKYNQELRILTLTYSENVKALSKAGVLQYTMTSYKSSDITGYLDYTVVSEVDNVIEIALKNLTLYGTYTITLDEGFVYDKYRNQSTSKNITLYNIGGEDGTNKLAEPYSIYQSDVNNSIIYVEFADRLDPASALDDSNYSVSGATVKEVKLIKNNADGAKIQLVMAKGTITTNGKRTIRISGIKGYNGSYSEMASYSTEIDLLENTDPQLKNIVYDATAKDIIKLVFTENISGTIELNIQERYTGYPIDNTVTVSGDTVTVKLGRVPDDGTHLVIYVQDNKIVDLNGNESTLNPVLYTFVNY